MIDTLKLHTRDFEIGPNADLDLKQGPINLKTKNIMNHHFLYKDTSGKYIFGPGAKLNTQRFNLDITLKGLHVKFTPAKNYHGCNYFPIKPNELKLVTAEIQKELKEHDIHLNIDNTDISRIDLAKNIHTDQPFIAYSELFAVLEGKRMKSTECGGEYYRYSNKSRQIVFYDKLNELKINQKINFERFNIPKVDTMRGEIRFMDKAIVKRDLPVTRSNELYKPDAFEALALSHRHYIRDLVFRKNDDDKLKFNFLSHVELLKALREKHPRNAIHQHLNMIGINQLLFEIGNLETYRILLKEAGFQERYTYKVIRELQETLKMRSEIDLLYEENTLSSQYDEILTKLSA